MLPTLEESDVDGDWALPAEEELLSRNFLLMFTEENFLGWGMLRVGAFVVPGADCPFGTEARRGVEVEAGDGEAEGESARGPSCLLTDGASTTAFVEGPWTSDPW